MAIPYEVVLVVIGAALGFLPFRENLLPKPELVLLVFLPPLLFEGVWHFDTAQLAAHWPPTALLAIVGTLGTAALAAAGVHGLWGVDWATALLFGAIVCATDPIAVLSIFRNVHAPPALAAIIEGESLINDGVAVVLFRIFVAAAAGGAVLRAVPAAWSFVEVTAVGIACGAAVGGLAVTVLRYARWQWFEILLTLVTAYGSYVVAEALHASGIFAVLAAALFVNARERRTQIRHAVAAFWDRLALAANIVLWSIVGLQIDLSLVAHQVLPVLLAIVATYLARAVAVFALMPLLPHRVRPRRRWHVVLVWGGLRGAIAMALALSLPLGFPHRQLLVAATAGVVFVTLVLGGTTMQPLLGRLGLAHVKHR